MTPPARAALLALAAALAGFSPFEAEEENVRAGNERLRAGDPAAALRAYDAAERAVGARPEIDFDRGHAALGARRPGEAKAAWERVAASAPPALASRALQNLGTVLAREGDAREARRALERALEADPSNEDARWNLEVLLREEAERRPEPQEAGEGRDEQPRADARGGRQGPEPRPAPDDPAPAPDPGARDRGDPAGEGPAPGAPLSRQDAEALLDALRAREQRMPLFGREREERRRPDGAKDW